MTVVELEVAADRGFQVEPADGTAERRAAMVDERVPSHRRITLDEAAAMTHATLSRRAAPSR